MHKPTTQFLKTTVDLPLDTMASLDLVKAKRTRDTGKRPTIRALMLEAMDSFIACELGGSRR
jgi:hypothetical protein